MPIVRFLTIDKDKITNWCTTNDVKMYRDFIQYVLDNCNRPGDYKILDTSTNKMYPLLEVAKYYKMRKRTFDERMKDISTGNMLIIH